MEQGSTLIKKPILDLIIRNVPVFNEKETVSNVFRKIVKDAVKYNTLDYIYIIDDYKHLVGVISIKEIFKSPKSTSLNFFKNKKVISVRIHTEQERVAMFALKYNIKAVPVVDKEDIFLGIVTYDEILKIMHKEGVDNILRFGGILSTNTQDDIFTLPLLTSIKHRLPWLVLGLIGGILAAVIVGSFEKVISYNLILAAYIPLIVYMADAIGTQMEAFIIRDLALKPELNLSKYFLRQAFIIFILSIILSTVIYFITYFLHSDIKISLVLSLALFCAIVSSLFTGIVIPYFFEKLGFDPANASGPIATIIQDVVSIFIYFSIASYILL